ncbi:hypothetical protein HK104_009295 [Borealophlyctis nickersoniae]|nr:hypothetical protein HK104_009295 [Borealophlyctis nickersoniae]
MWSRKDVNDLAIATFSHPSVVAGIVEKEGLRREFKRKFNGEVVGRICGVEGKELGRVIVAVKERLGGDGEDMWKKVVGMTEAEVEAVVRAVWQGMSGEAGVGYDGDGSG